MKLNDLNYYQKMFDEVFQSVGQAIEIDVLLLILERSLRSIKENDEDAYRITFSEEGIFLEGLKELDEQTAVVIAHDFMISIIATLGRLVGRQLFEKLAKQIKLSDKED